VLMVMPLTLRENSNAGVEQVVMVRILTSGEVVAGALPWSVFEHVHPVW
jgi:hypothetical protein